MARDSSVNFYLKEPNKDGLCWIFLQFKYRNKRLKYYIKKSIDPKLWDAKRQRVVDLKRLDDNLRSLNNLLDSLRARLVKTFTEHINSGKGVPTVELLKDDLDNFYLGNGEMNRQSKSKDMYSLIDRFIQGEIKFKGRSVAAATKQTYEVVKKHLHLFENVKKYKINFESITLDFFYKYVDFMEKLPRKRNTIAKDIRVIKRFMGEAVDLGFTTNLQFKNSKFFYSEEDVDAVYLTEQEIEKLFELDLSAKKKLERVRDLFVFGCLAGLRYGDYSDIKPQNIVYLEGEPFIKRYTNKTNELVWIPCDQFVLKIFERYIKNDNKLPAAISNQKFNDYVKEVCEIAMFTETGRNHDRPDLQLCQCVSSHTARRSFATNLYLQGYPTLEIMKISGHVTEKAFLKYIKVSKLQAAKRLGEFMKMRWQQKIAKLNVEIAAVS